MVPITTEQHCYCYSLSQLSKKDHIDYRAQHNFITTVINLSGDTTIDKMKSDESLRVEQKNPK